MKNKKRIGDENHGKQRKKEFNREANDLCGSCMGLLSVSFHIFVEFLNGHGNGNVWNIINAIFFQDITTTDGFEGLGLFYIIG